MATTSRDAAVLLPAQRQRLVRLCSRLGGSGAPAEDLAQETLLEAWRSWDRLRDPERYEQWLSAIARNVCLRWKNKHISGGAISVAGGYLTIEGADIQLAAEVDIELELERSEIEEFLDRAMGFLVGDAREILVQRYVEDLPVSEISARTGRSVGAVAVRLHRARQALHQVLTAELREESIALGLMHTDEAHRPQSTRIWCPHCGMARVRMECNAAAGSMRALCPNCGATTVDQSAHYLSEVKGFWRSLLRSHAEANAYFRGALAAGSAPCACCGTMSPLRHSIPRRLTGLNRDARGVHVLCPHCNAVSLQPDGGLTLALPDVQRFWRRHKRIRTVGPLDITAGGRDTFLVRFEHVGSTEALEVVSAADTFEVLHTNFR